MKPIFTFKGLRLTLIALLLTCLGSNSIAQTLGTYSFNGFLLGTCPNNNNEVTTQPANATFSPFVNVNGNCVASLSEYINKGWNGTLAYNRFTITPQAGYVLNLNSISFKHQTDRNADGWELRSSLDNFTSIISSGIVS